MGGWVGAWVVEALRRVHRGCGGERGCAVCRGGGGGGKRRRRKTRQPASASNFFPSTHPNPPAHPPTPTRWTILKGDKVEVINGPEKGKQGTVLKVLRDQNRVVIEGVNVRRRTQKPTPNGNPGRSHPLPLPIHPPTYLSMVYSSTSNPPTHPPTQPPTHRSSFHPPTHPPTPSPRQNRHLPSRLKRLQCQSHRPREQPTHQGFSPLPGRRHSRSRR